MPVYTAMPITSERAASGHFLGHRARASVMLRARYFDAQGMAEAFTTMNDAEDTRLKTGESRKICFPNF